MDLLIDISSLEITTHVSTLSLPTIVLVFIWVTGLQLAQVTAFQDVASRNRQQSSNSFFNEFESELLLAIKQKN